MTPFQKSVLAISFWQSFLLFDDLKFGPRSLHMFFNLTVMQPLDEIRKLHDLKVIIPVTPDPSAEN